MKRPQHLRRRETLTTQVKLIQRKLSLLTLADNFKSVSEPCRVIGVSRQHLYDTKEADSKGANEALRNLSRCKPNIKNRIAVRLRKLALDLQAPAMGQGGVANELRMRRIILSLAGVWCVWHRQGR